MVDFEDWFIAQCLRPLVSAPGAVGLSDDVARLDTAGVVIASMDTLVEGVHFLPDDPADSVGWKALAVNVSDIAAKGALPREALMSVSWPRGTSRERATAFARGLGEALAAFGVALVGGDTVVTPGPLGVTIALTGACLGQGPVRRSGGRVGDTLYTINPERIGSAGIGLEILQGRVERGDDPDAPGLVAAYRRPWPAPAVWAPAIARHGRAAMDISDGLLIDAGRLADASGTGLLIDLDGVGSARTLEAALERAKAGDDYVPLVAGEPGDAGLWAAGFRPVGRLTDQVGARTLRWGGQPVEWPARTGWSHG